MSNKIFCVFLLFVSSGMGQNAATSTATGPSNDELLARGKKIFVVTDTYYVQKGQLESGLINRKELVEWGIQVVQSADQAELILKVDRAPFQSNFPFTFTDRESGIIVMGGTVNSLFGTVPGKIAGRLADRLKEIKQGEKRAALGH